MNLSNEIVPSEMFRSLTSAEGSSALASVSEAGPVHQRKLEPVDFLLMFSDWVSDQYRETSERLLRQRYNVRKRAAQAAAEFEAGKSPTEPGVLRNWVNNALWIAQVDSELSDLEELHLMACAAADLCGHFDFNKRTVRDWFERFLNDTERCKRWEATGYTIADLRKIQSPLARKKLGLSRWKSGIG